MITSDTRELILEGALIGAALGTPFSGLKEGHIQQLLEGRAEGFLADGRIYPARPEKNRLPGLHGVATQRLLASLSVGISDEMAREPVAVAGAALIDLAGGMEGEDLGSVRQAGRPLIRAIRRWRSEYPWAAEDYFTEEEESAGIAPVLSGLAPVLLNMEAPWDIAAKLARLTHQHPYTIAGAFTIARLALSITDHIGVGKKLDAVSVARELVEAVREFETNYTTVNQRKWREDGWAPPATPLWECLSALPSLLRESNDDLAVRTIVNTARDCHPAHGVSHVQNGFVPAGLCWAIYRALGELAPVPAIEDVINRGGESETIAGVVGAIMCARYGPGSLSPEWQEGCLGLEIGRELLRSPSPETQGRWLSLEAEWSSREAALQAPLREAEEAKKRASAEKERQRKKKIRDENAVGDLPDQEQALFAPPPHLWVEPGDEEHPAIKRKLKAARGKKKIGWKEDRRKHQREDN
ncbi:MAG: ADP-ribosylglycohydrolase family protein [Candidatus Sumerlaeia bacterium]|nr:ADP-ribosylglycohydrolase family protein [Candidatus Sumerlaeia bacterium]